MIERHRRDLQLDLLVALLEAALDVEMRAHLKVVDLAHRGRPNSRNGFRSKPLRTDLGNVMIAMPRDRLGTFDPVVVPKRRRFFDKAGLITTLFLAETVGPHEAQLAVGLIYPERTPEAIKIAVVDRLLVAARDVRRDPRFRQSDPLTPFEVPLFRDNRGQSNIN